MNKKVSVKIIIIMIIAAIFTVPSSVLQISHAQSDANFQNTILEIHNRERAAVGVPALVWSDELAAGAQTWADHVAALGTSVHSTTQGYGENIAWQGPPGPGTLAPMVESWVNEKNGYNVAPFQWDRDVAHAHYTAMVWGTTTEVGCGMASGSENDFLVCRYRPGGNINGQLPYGQGAAPAVAAPLQEEGAAAPPADQAAGDEDDCAVLISSQCTGAPPADQAAGDEDAGAPPADQAAGDEGDGDGDGEEN
jgi:pathogenesis-related protein 1